jgi:hypothetical protein
MSDPFSELANDYWLGVDALGAAQPQSTISIQNVTPPSYTSSLPTPAPAPIAPAPAPFYGPGDASMTYYTDKASITAVQKKLTSMGYYHGDITGKWDEQLDAAVYNATGMHGPPNDAIMKKLGLATSVDFTDDQVDSMVVQAKTATTPAQVQVVVAKVENLTKDAPDDVKSDVAAAKQAAAIAKTQADLDAAKKQLADALEKLRPQKWPAWKIATVAGASVAGVGLLFGLVALARRK